jgi:hypothetical protein
LVVDEIQPLESPLGISRQTSSTVLKQKTEMKHNATRIETLDSVYSGCSMTLCLTFVLQTWGRTVADLRQRTLVSVRTQTCSQSSRTTAFARNFPIELGIPLRFDVAEPSLTSAEQMQGLLASDVIDRIESLASAKLANGLRYLDMIGATNPKRRGMMNLNGLKQQEAVRTSGFPPSEKAIKGRDS